MEGTLGKTERDLGNDIVKKGCQLSPGFYLWFLFVFTCLDFFFSMQLCFKDLFISFSFLGCAFFPLLLCF